MSKNSIIAVSIFLLILLSSNKSTGATGGTGTGSFNFAAIPDGTVNNLVPAAVNHNPLNMKGTSSQTFYQNQTGVNSVWRVFSNKIWGYRAGLHLMERYFNDWGQNTIETIIKGNSNHGGWSSTDQGAYSNFIAQYSGFGLNETLTWNKETAKRITLPMARFEAGFKYVDESDFEAAWNVL